MLLPSSFVTRSSRDRGSLCDRRADVQYVSGRLRYVEPMSVRVLVDRTLPMRIAYGKSVNSDLTGPELSARLPPLSQTQTAAAASPGSRSGERAFRGSV
jgi:hypothetical protein